MPDNPANGDNANGRSAFPTSSTDFALPFGTPRPIPASHGNSATGSSNAGFFQTASSSVPISIPSSPSLSLGFNRSVNNQHAPLLPLSSGLEPSPSKLATSGAGLGIGNLPMSAAREHSIPLAPSHPSSMFNHGAPQSPTLSLAGEGWPISPFTAFPSAPSSSSSAGGVTTPSGLLRRAPGMTSPGFAIASPARFRRASMLGREITPFHLDQEDRSDQEDGLHDTATQQAANGRRASNQDPDDGDDEMMQVEEDDTLALRAPSTPVMGPPLSLFSTPGTPPPSSSHLTTRPSLVPSALGRASASDSGQDSSSSGGGGVLSRTVPRSPSAGPSMGSPLGHGGNRSRSSSLLSSNVVRKAVTRRGNLLPKDRSMSRVAASLIDESKPEDSEIASEAKLQKRLGGEATLPRTPRFGLSANSSSSAAGGSMRMSKSPFFGATPAGGAGSSRRKYMWDEDVDDIRGVFTADGLDDSSSGMSSEEEEMMYCSRGSLSDEENELRSRGYEASNLMQDAVSADTSMGTGAETAALSTSVGSAGGPSTGVGSVPKRKNALWMGFRDRGNAHKWSPGGSSNAPNERWRRPPGAAMDLDTSPRVLGAAAASARSKRKTMMGEERYEPYKRRAVSPMNLGSSLGTTPTNINLVAAAAAASSSAAGMGLSGGGGAGGNSPLMMPIASPFPRIHYAAYTRYSTSPTISRPITPVNATTAGMGAFSPAATGSGPGYGSGALGLSISANHTQSMDMQEQEQNEALMDEKVGLMGLS